LKIETHLLDFDSDMYGDEIQVEFYSFVRGEIKFSGKDALVAQIQGDIAAARAKLSAF
jgi:riboflavin kinase/FMN adenylyltransferase